jgi:metallo-beta-lactamase class B
MLRTGLCLTILLGLVQGIPPSMIRPEYTLAQKPFTIAGNLHFVGSKGLSSFLITTPQGHILIDSGLDETARQILENIRTLGFKSEDVKILLDGHAHFDHVAGHARIVQFTRAAVWAMDGDAGVLESGGKTDYLFGGDVSFPAVKVDRVLHDGDAVRLGGSTLIAHRLSGHTRGNTAWAMTVRDGAKSYSVLIAGSMSINPGTRLFKRPSYPGISEDYAAGFAWLRAQHPDIFLGPHTGFFHMEDKLPVLAAHPAANPFVDPAGYREYIDYWEKQYLKQLAEERGGR